MGLRRRRREESDAIRPRRVRRGRRRRLLRGVSGLMALAGLVLLAMVAQEFLGTGVAASHAQAAIRQDIARHGFPHRVIPGKALALLSIPTIDVNVAVVEGVAPDDLARGPGHYPDTPLPGAGGNTVIAGHRTTHGAPFWSLDDLKPGDLIQLQTRRGHFVYRVTWRSVLPQDAWGATEAASGPALTLTTCWPRFSSRQRLVVHAVQVYGRSPEGFVGARGLPPTA